MTMPFSSQKLSKNIRPKLNRSLKPRTGCLLASLALPNNLSKLLSTLTSRRKLHGAPSKSELLLTEDEIIDSPLKAEDSLAVTGEWVSVWLYILTTSLVWQNQPNFSSNTETLLFVLLNSRICDKLENILTPSSSITFNQLKASEVHSTSREGRQYPHLLSS